MSAARASQASIQDDELVISFTFYGNAGELWDSTAPEIVLVGAAGTGKSRACLEKLHYEAATNPALRCLMVRKTYASLKASGLVTFDEKVMPQLDGVRFVGETAKRPPHYAYPNGSVIVVGGLDRPSKVMSSEYDLIYVQEATELTENDWEALTTRLRNAKLPYQQLLADCNPDAPTHWLKLRGDAGKTLLLPSTHADNPTLYNHDLHDWTPEGLRYLAVLDALSGVRHDRLRLGIWAAAEGMIYADSWSEPRNLINYFRPPLEWPRYLSIDFGFTHPFVCQWWAQDPDGRLYLYRELYQTQRLVEDHARSVRAASGWGGMDGAGPTIPLDLLGKQKPHVDPLPRAIFADHDAEGRATFERHLGLYTTAAHKAVKEGIDAVAARMRPAGDGRPRLFVMRDSLLERDQWLVERKLPTCTAEEIPGYVWDLAHAAAAAKEQPVKDNDHGVDALRYLVASLDCRQSTVQWGPKIW